jgi:hypothetical protein
METFTLIVWLYVGARFEEVRIEKLARDECAETWLRIYGDRKLVKGGCADATAYVAPPPVRSRTIIECAQHPCGSPVPGPPEPNRRV